MIIYLSLQIHSLISRRPLLLGSHLRLVNSYPIPHSSCSKLCTFQQPSILPRPPSLLLDEPLPSRDCRDGHLRGVSLQPCHRSTRISESLTLLKLFLLPCAWKAVLLQGAPFYFPSLVPLFPPGFHFVTCPLAAP